jgi:hypothetical protein
MVGAANRVQACGTKSISIVECSADEAANMATAPDDRALPSESRPYEFTPEQERLIADLAAKMRFVGFFAVLFGLLGVALMIYVWVLGILWVDVGTLVLFLLGFWVLGAARSFRAVAETQGHDVTHLMHALGDLHRMFALLYWVLSPRCSW